MGGGADLTAPGPLDAAAVARFIEQGAVRLDDAFPREIAAEARAILWGDMGLSEAEPAGWTHPVVRLGYYGQEPFRCAAQSPLLQTACDQLVGAGRWQPLHAIGTFPIRFPSPDDQGDAGWHVDMSFGVENPDFMEWRINWCSRGRALLLLFLFSDIGEDDAPTRIRLGSHRDIARQLAPAGEEGLTLRQLAAHDFATSAARPETLATGAAGAVWLCHPFLVNAAQSHRGTRPRFLAQPPLLRREPLDPGGAVERLSPVERAIREAMEG